MQTYLPSLRRRGAGSRRLAGALGATARRVRGFLRATSTTAGAAALLFALLAMPATAGTTLVSGTSVFNDDCQPPVGGPPANLGDLPPIDFSGSLDGCWYTYISASRFNPSGTYVEQGTELFVGCLNGTTCGTFETTYTFTGKYANNSFNEPLFGRCEHSIVGGTGDFADVKGVITIRDDTVNLTFDYRGQIHLAKPGEGSTATALQGATKATGSYGLVRPAGC